MFVARLARKHLLTIERTVEGHVGEVCLVALVQILLTLLRLLARLCVSVREACAFVGSLLLNHQLILHIVDVWCERLAVWFFPLLFMVVFFAKLEDTVLFEVVNLGLLLLEVVQV